MKLHWNYFLIFSILGWGLNDALAQESLYDTKSIFGTRETSVITDPAISKRCFLMIERRHEKLKMKQKIRALTERNRLLLKVVPLNKETVRNQLSAIKRSLSKEEELILMKIQHLEESIVRKGCPGINLR